MKKNDEIKFLTLSDNVTSILRNRILTGNLPPGSRIIELEIAKELGLSRGPVREALRKLAYEGIIDYHSNKGCTVRTLTSKEVEDVYVVKVHLEILSVDLCNGKFTQKTIEDMGELIREMEQASKEKNVLRLSELDEQFHSLIILESKNHKLFELWSSLRSISLAIISSAYNLKLTNLKNQGENHKVLFENIKKGERERINHYLKRHYDDSTSRFKLLGEE